ncbi:MAG: hypothetical protein RIS94_3602, partial [Pseudomonadota bacterium]
MTTNTIAAPERASVWQIEMVEDRPVS